jgi:primosomal protein N' (replication factor Y)
MRNEPSHKSYVQVVIPIPVNHPYTYRVPKDLVQEIQLGVRVLVPFGPRKVTGFVVDITDRTDYADKLKPVLQVLDPVPLFTTNVLQLAKWIAEYYLCSWGEVLKAALPAGIHLSSEKVVRLLHPDPRTLYEELTHRAPRQAEVIRALIQDNPLPVKRLKRVTGTDNLYSVLNALQKRRWIRQELSLPNARVRSKYIEFISMAPEISPDTLRDAAREMRARAPKQAACLDMVLDYENEDLPRYELTSRTGASSATIKSLVEKQYLHIERRRIERTYYDSIDAGPKPDITLNPDQLRALDTIEEALHTSKPGTLLLHGVTGSGKTQVYIEAIQRTLDIGKTAIVLVPEISLTPQMVRRFYRYFKEDIAVFHSRMSPGERYDSWRRTWEGRHRIVIGPRSAIFAPLKNIGLIVVDEEHEASYKQNDVVPRYHARDVAIVRAHLNGALVVLGSATPATESYFNAAIRKYTLIDMPNRIDNIKMPDVKIVDMRKEPRIIGRKDPIILSKTLRDAIDKTLSKGEQIILLQNRRGFATILKCKDCGYTANCEHCDITLTYHLSHRMLKCHYCGYSKKAPTVCPNCNGTDIFMRGVGTQRVEEELHYLFPNIRVARMDLDTTKGRRAHDRILKQFGKKEMDILLGTQMVAKGLDFPNVTLVGVISADTELLFPDYRAGERSFQLLTQVAGRAGRKQKTGTVIIQTYSPDHYSLEFTQKHDYANFFKRELAERKELEYPPYSHMVNVLFRGDDHGEVQQAAEAFAEAFKNPGHVIVRGPSPALLSKIQNQYRWQILFSSVKQRDKGGRAMKSALQHAFDLSKTANRSSDVRISMDVDPVSLI